MKKLQIDFYTRVHAPEVFACRLVARVYHSGARLLVWLDSLADLERFDLHLWNYSDVEFIPHAKIKDETVKSSPVILAIAGDFPTDDSPEVLLNLSRFAVDEFTTGPLPVSRVLEIVGHSEGMLAEARIRYARYTKMQAEIHHHDMSQHQG